MLTIPQNIIESARAGGTSATDVRSWFVTQLAAAGLQENCSPADWPDDLWQAFKTLSTLDGAPDIEVASARSLFAKLGMLDEAE